MDRCAQLTKDQIVNHENLKMYRFIKIWLRFVVKTKQNKTKQTPNSRLMSLSQFSSFHAEAKVYEGQHPDVEAEVTGLCCHFCVVYPWVIWPLCTLGKHSLSVPLLSRPWHLLCRQTRAVPLLHLAGEFLLAVTPQPCPLLCRFYFFSPLLTVAVLWWAPTPNVPFS